MADVPLPEPDGVVKAMWNVVRHGPNYDGRERDVIAAARAYAERYAAAVSAAKDAEIAQLRADLIKSLADNKALRERVRVLEDALREYANPLNWNEDSAGIRRVWLEPRSTTPAAYNGFEAARAALEKP